MRQFKWVKYEMERSVHSVYSTIRRGRAARQYALRYPARKPLPDRTAFTAQYIIASRFMLSSPVILCPSPRLCGFHLVTLSTTLRDPREILVLSTNPRVERSLKPASQQTSEFSETIVQASTEVLKLRDRKLGRRHGSVNCRRSKRHCPKVQNKNLVSAPHHLARRGKTCSLRAQL